MRACYALHATPCTLYARMYGRAVSTHSSAYSIEVAVEEAMLDVENSGAIEEVIEETIVESNAIVEAMEEAIEEHRADIEAIEEAREEALAGT